MSLRDVVVLMTGVMIAAVPPVFSDGTHGDRVAPLDNVRSTAADEFLNWSWQNIETYFAIPKAIAKDHFDSRLLKGVTDAVREKDPEEKDIASVVADLFGTINDQQAIDLVNWTEAAKKAIEAKPAESRTDVEKQKLVLLTRLRWAAKIVRGEEEPFTSLLADVEDGEPFQKFKSAFTPEWTRVLAKNEAYHQTLAQAEKGDETARQKLTAGYKGVASFIKGQVDSNNTGLVSQIAKGHAEKLPDSSYVMDFLDPAGKRLRVVLGKTPEKFGDALSEAFGKDGGIPEGIAQLKAVPMQKDVTVDQTIHTAASRETPPSIGTAPTVDSAPLNPHAPSSPLTPTPPADASEAIAKQGYADLEKLFESGVREPIPPHLFDADRMIGMTCYSYFKYEKIPENYGASGAILRTYRNAPTSPGKVGVYLYEDSPVMDSDAESRKPDYWIRKLNSGGTPEIYNPTRFTEYWGNDGRGPDPLSLTSVSIGDRPAGNGAHLITPATPGPGADGFDIIQVGGKTILRWKPSNSPLAIGLQPKYCTT